MSSLPEARARTAVARAAAYPRLRYMGSKYRLVPQLAEVFAGLGGNLGGGLGGGGRALDAFSGSGVVAYTLKALGYAVTANDFLAFPAVIAEAAVVNSGVRLSEEDVETVCGPPADDRDFVARTFDGLYFTAEDRAFLDSAWSHLDSWTETRRALGIAALLLAAARKQPRGVFTVTGVRYDDGRPDLRLPLRAHFRRAVADYAAVVFDNGRAHRASCADVSALDPSGYDVVYLDPPYAPPRDDNCYVKRYHFLEGLAVYWRGVEIMAGTRTRKLAKRHTPFSYPGTVVAALRATLRRFAGATIVLSYSSNAVPDPTRIEALVREVCTEVQVRRLEHRYSFGTHSAAHRRTASEYLFIGR